MNERGKCLRERASFLDAPLDVFTQEQTVDIARAAMRERRPTLQVSLNVAKLVGMRRDTRLREDVHAADVVSADGMGVVWGARLCGIDVPERVAGVDLMEALLGLCSREGFSPFLLGAHPQNLEAAVERIRLRFPDLTLAGWHHGYFSRAEEAAVAESIRASRADCLIVGISTPKKEEFIRRLGRDVGAGFVMGVGGGLDVWAGVTSRAPLWLRRAGLEWLYRLAQEPRRLWKRYLFTNLAFAWLLIPEVVRRAWRHRAFAGPES